MIKVRRFFKAQAVADFGNIPVSVLQQGFGFGYEAFKNQFGGGFAGHQAYGTVKVINMHVELLSKGFGRAHTELLRYRLYGKLAFQLRR